MNTVEQKREKQTLAAGHVTWAVKSNTSFSCLSQELPKTKQNLFNSKDPRPMIGNKESEKWNHIFNQIPLIQ